MLERVQRELGVRVPEHEMAEPIGLPRQYLGLLGNARAARLEQVLAIQIDRVRDLPGDQLRALVQQEQAAFSRLDHHAAGLTLRLEREQAQYQDAARRQAARAAQLEDHASALGWRARDERDQLRRDAALQRDHATHHVADGERLELDLTRLRAAGRHPEQWLAENASQLAAGIVAGAELAHRKHREIDHQIERAFIQPPAHVLELIGQSPVSGARLAHQWERLAERIERHRLGYEVDVDRDGPLGPEPFWIARDQRDAYVLQREQIAADIETYRDAMRLPLHEQARDIVREREQAQELQREL